MVNDDATLFGNCLVLCSSRCRGNHTLLVSPPLLVAMSYRCRLLISASSSLDPAMRSMSSVNLIRVTWRSLIAMAPVKPYNLDMFQEDDKNASSIQSVKQLNTHYTSSIIRKLCYTYKNDVTFHVDFASLIRVRRRMHYGLAAYM